MTRVLREVIFISYTKQVRDCNKNQVYVLFEVSPCSGASQKELKNPYAIFIEYVTFWKHQKVTKKCLCEIKLVPRDLGGLKQNFAQASLRSPKIKY